MKNTIKTIASILVIVLFAGSYTAMAQTITDTKSNTAKAEVLSSIALTAVGPMEFGGLSSAATAGTLVLSTAGGRTATGGVTLLTTTVTPAAASYSVTGSQSTLYYITLPTSNVIITRVSGTETMAVNTFTSSVGASSTLSATGDDTFTVGATLNVDANQVSGTYTGSFDVTVAY